MSARILIVEDEPAIRELVAVNLRHAGYLARESGDADSAVTMIEAERPDLILLDWMLPGISGIDFARRLRERASTRDIPIIMLTARAQEGDKLQGFESGADDYVTKPFSPRELLARVRAMLRRAAPEVSEDPVEAAGLRLEPATYRAYAGEAQLSLSPTEFKLLHYFLRNPDRVLSRSKLLDKVWGDAVYIEERTVDVHIRRLRLALRPTGHDRAIETVRGGGYRLALA